VFDSVGVAGPFRERRLRLGDGPCGLDDTLCGVTGTVLIAVYFINVPEKLRIRHWPSRFVQNSPTAM
jgi:hypothetical protein